MRAVTGALAVVLAVSACSDSGSGRAGAGSEPRSTSAAPAAFAAGVATTPVPSDGCVSTVDRPGSGFRHLDEGERLRYNEFPVVAGPHDARPLPAGRYSTPLVDGPAGADGTTLARLVHSLEHAYVAVLHTDEVDLEALDVWHARHAPQGKLIVVPAGRHEMQHPIALLAWERLSWCSTIDPPAMDSFLQAHRRSGRAPEPHAD